MLLLNWILLRWSHLNLSVFPITSQSLANIKEKSLFSAFLFYNSLQKTISTLQPRHTFFNSFQRILKSNWPAWPATQDNCENLLEFWKRKMKEIGVPTLPAYWHPDLVFKNPFKRRQSAVICSFMCVMICGLPMWMGLFCLFSILFASHQLWSIGG